MHFDGNEYLIIINYYSKMPFVKYLHPNAMLPRWYPLWRNCLLSMAYQSHYTVTMAPSLPVPSLQNLPLTGTSTSAPTNPHSNGQVEAAMKIIQGTTYTIQVLRTRSLPCPTCIPQYPCGCRYVLTWSDALPACLAHKSATAYPPYWPTCYCWPWLSRPACLPECSKPRLSRLLTEILTVC